MKKLSILLLVILSFIVLPASASIAKWLVKPQYDTICYYSNNLFKCVKDGKIQLINKSGKTLLPETADSITDFSEGYALVLDWENTKLKIKGLITENYFTAIGNGYYATYYSHFSEGCIVVADHSGKYGYLNSKGERIIECLYQKARPILQGWASVVNEKGKTLYIDRNNNVLTIHGFHFGNLSQGTSFNEKGEALVCCTNKISQSNYAVINTRGQVVRKYSKTSQIPVRDYDFAFDEENIGFEPQRNKKPAFDPSIEVFSSDGLFGYRTATKAIVPVQFSHADQFSEGCAIVGLYGKYGIITLTAGDFFVAFDSQDITFHAGKPKVFQFTLSFPDHMKASDLQIRLDKGSSYLMPIILENNGYSFVPFIEKKAKSCTIRIDASMDGLRIWEKTIILNVNRKNSMLYEIGIPAKTSEYANTSDLLTVKSFVTNLTDMPAKISVVFSVPLSFAEGTKNRIVSNLTQEEILAPKEKKEYSISFHVEDLETVKLTMTVKANHSFVGSKSADIILKPYDF
jgi:hypothetical protein